MGKALFEASETARRVFRRADEILGFALTRMCFEGPERDKRHHQRPAGDPDRQHRLFDRDAGALAGDGASGRPQYVAGHSLGEFTALVAADVLDFDSALVLVRERGRLMKENGTERPGGMLAVLGLDREVVEAVVAEQRRPV